MHVSVRLLNGHGRNGFRRYSNVYSGVTTSTARPERTKYDAVIIGAGQNALINNNY